MVLKYFKQKPLTEIRKFRFYGGFTYIIYKATIVERAADGDKADCSPHHFSIIRTIKQHDA